MSSYKSSLLYKQRVDELVGDQNPLEILSSTISKFSELLRPLSKTVLESTDYNKWSISDILQHLVDAELTNGYRVRMVLSETKPMLPGYNQEYWVERFNTAISLKEILTKWSVLRDYNLRLLQTLTDDEKKRGYIHQERGEEILQDLLILMAGHDLMHWEQVNRILREIANKSS